MIFGRAPKDEMDSIPYIICLDFQPIARACQAAVVAAWGGKLKKWSL